MTSSLMPVLSAAHSLRDIQSAIELHKDGVYSDAQLVLSVQCANEMVHDQLVKLVTLEHAANVQVPIRVANGLQHELLKVENRQEMETPIEEDVFESETDDDDRRVWLIVHSSVAYLQYPKYLLAQRAAHINNGGQWGFIGGHPKKGQSNHDAMTMELLEETGISMLTIQPGDFFAERIRHRKNKGAVTSTYFRIMSSPEYWKAKSKLTPEVQAYRWISRSDLRTWALAQADDSWPGDEVLHHAVINLMVDERQKAPSLYVDGTPTL